jgi:molecular chaperone HtpG
MTAAETLPFQAETKSLLDLVINSLYTNKEIFLRELISNASDALDALRFQALTRPELYEGDETLAIRLEVDPQARTLTVSDNGIGMTREQVVANIGTIAHSGTRELREKLKSNPAGNVAAELIGQFGVGFYSSFMVGDKVTLVTRAAGEKTATLWESKGDGQYTISEAEKPSRGTTIKIHLKPVDHEAGIEDYTNRWTLSRIVKKHSDFVSHPIIFRGEKDAVDEATPKPESESTSTVIEEKTLNSMRPIWARPKSELQPSDYNEFYKHISHDWNEPLETIHLKAEGAFEYQSILFVPGKAPNDLYYQGYEFGLQLYAKRVMVVERCEDLLPHYLRFVKGIVDAVDLPLNISRQLLQQDRHVAQIRKWLTKKVLEVLEEMRQGDAEKFLSFWEGFGKALKEGVSADHDNRDRIIALLLFPSSNEAAKLTSLKDYVARMKEGQNDIFYLSGESRAVVENSPHLEGIRAKGYEVLYFTDAVDELLAQTLHEFEGKRLRSVGKGTLDLNPEESKESRESKEKALEEKNKEYSDLLEFVREKLEPHLKRARLTSRLTKSPACLVGDEMDYSPHLERLLRKGKDGGPKQRRILELNPEHEIVAGMRERFAKDKADPLLADYAQLLFGYALIAEGSELEDPVRFNRLVAELMARSLT